MALELQGSWDGSPHEYYACDIFFTGLGKVRSFFIDQVRFLFPFFFFFFPVYRPKIGMPYISLVTIMINYNFCFHILSYYVLLSFAHNLNIIKIIKKIVKMCVCRAAII